MYDESKNWGWFLSMAFISYVYCVFYFILTIDTKPEKRWQLPEVIILLHSKLISFLTNCCHQRQYCPKIFYKQAKRKFEITLLLVRTTEIKNKQSFLFSSNYTLIVCMHRIFTSQHCLLNKAICKHHTHTHEHTYDLNVYT
jgi:hypothetical protein